MSKRIGALLLFLVVAVVVAYQLLGRRGAGSPSTATGPSASGPTAAPVGPAITVKGLIGGEKTGLLKDERVQRERAQPL